MEYYHTFYRKYDAQIGRFTGIDIASEEYSGLTPFQFGANNPVLFNDPFGDRLQLPAELYGSSANPALEDLGNDLSWERQSYDDVWGWLDEEMKTMNSGGWGADFWGSLLNAFENGIDEGPIKSFVTDCIGRILNKGSNNTVFMINADGSLDYLGTLGGVLIVDKLLLNLIAYNSGMASLMGLANPIEFALWSMPNGKWDFKTNINHIVGYAHTVYDKEHKTQTLYNFKGISMEAQDFGNVHYGAVGRSTMFSESQLLKAAGVVQMLFGDKKDSKWLRPEMFKKYFGDDPRDQHWIKQGFKIYNNIFKSNKLNLNWGSWLLESFGI